MRYALVMNGKVDNVIEADYTASQLIAEYLNCLAVCVDLFSVGVGHNYDGKVFTDENGKVINQLKTTDENLSLMQKALDDLILGGVV